jgi:hypothetical protein
MSRVALLVVLAVSRMAFADERVTATVEPMLLVMPMVDATVEVKAAPHVGLAARAGYGHVGIPLVAGGSIYELGGAAHYYLDREFSGWHVGAEAFWLWGETSGYLFDQEPASERMMNESSPERIVGAFGGYKWGGWRGLSAVVQLGVGHIDQSKSPDGPIHKVIPVANLDVGWTF